MGLPLSILIVDFDESICALVRDILSPEYQVVAAHDAVEAADRLFHEHYSLLIIDPEMPVLDGPEFIRLLRAFPSFAHLPVLLVTDPIQGRSEYDSLSVDRILHLPFAVHDLEQAVEELIRRPRPVSGRPAENRSSPVSAKGDTLSRPAN